MVLQYLRFKDNDKCVLYVYFGEKDNRAYGLKSENVPPDEAEIIRKKFRNNNKKEDTLAWLKENAPASYKNAYREYKKEDFILLTTHTLNPLV